MRFLSFLGLLSSILWFGNVSVYAQEAIPAEAVLFSLEAPFATGVTRVNGVISGKDVVVHLWGLSEINNSDDLKQKGREILQKAIGSAPLSCEYRGKAAGSNEIIAQCNNSNRQDLGLYIVQEGYAQVDHDIVSGTVFDRPYMKAQQRAQGLMQAGWNVQSGSQQSVVVQGSSSPALTYLSVGILLCVLLSFFILIIVLVRGFYRVMELQNNHINMMSREQKMRDKEREVIASMVDSELKTNKSKIEAYIVVYEETLSELKNTQKTPRYQKLGDIIQKQPSLTRVIFDKNSDKLHILGKKLSSELIHFYARIKTNPDYENIEPDMEVASVIRIIEEALDNARRLNTLADFLVKELEEGNFDQEEGVSAA